MANKYGFTLYLSRAQRQDTRDAAHHGPRCAVIHTRAAALNSREKRNFALIYQFRITLITYQEKCTLYGGGGRGMYKARESDRHARLCVLGLASLFARLGQHNSCAVGATQAGGRDFAAWA